MRERDLEFIRRILRYLVATSSEDISGLCESIGIEEDWFKEHLGADE